MYIGRIFGIDLRIDATLLLLFLIVGYQGYEGDGLHGLADQLTFLVFLFVCIFLHEMGHAGAARIFGIHTEQVTLHFYGGLARYAEPPRGPFEEAVMAIAGPIVNLSIALALYGLLHAEQGGSYPILTPYSDLLTTLLYANLVLGVFNLLPAFPLDGGSLLCAILSVWLSRPTARMVVAYLGIALGLSVAALGWFWLGNDTMTTVLGFLIVLLAFGEAVAARRSMGT